MGSAYKCDVTGKLCEGNGVQRLDVDITPLVRLEIIPHNKINDRQFGQGTIAPDVGARISAALLAEFGEKPGKK